MSAILIYRLLFATALASASCTAAPEPTTPLAAPLPLAIERAAITLDISLGAGPGTSSVARSRALNTPTTFASVLGHDAIVVEADSVTRTALGAVTPNKVRIRLKVRVRNSLARTVMIAPTFPTAPDRDGGLYLFVVQAVAIVGNGAATTVGNTVTVLAPSGGQVTVSSDWDGSSYDYLRSSFAGCPAAPTCARYERFAAPLGPAQSSEWRVVGFDVDPTVRSIRLRLVLAADVVNAD